jgi:hypothetical protein
MRKLLITLAAAAALFMPAAAASTATAAAAGPAAPLVTGQMHLTNGNNAAIIGQGLGQQVVLAGFGNGSTISNITESTNVCGGLHLYALKTANGYYLREPSGASTLNLSTTLDNRAKWVYLGTGHYGSYAGGCSTDTNVIYVPNDGSGTGVKVGTAPVGGFSEWTIS